MQCNVYADQFLTVYIIILRIPMFLFVTTDLYCK